MRAVTVDIGAADARAGRARAARRLVDAVGAVVDVADEVLVIAADARVEDGDLHTGSVVCRPRVLVVDGVRCPLLVAIRVGRDRRGMDRSVDAGREHARERADAAPNARPSERADLAAQHANTVAVADDCEDTETRALGFGSARRRTCHLGVCRGR